MPPPLKESGEITLTAYFLDGTTLNQAELPTHATHKLWRVPRMVMQKSKKGRMDREEI